MFNIEKDQGKNVFTTLNNALRSPEVFSRKGVLKICSKFTGEHPRRSVILL